MKNDDGDSDEGNALLTQGYVIAAVIGACQKFCV